MNHSITRRTFLALGAAGFLTATSNARVMGANERIRVGVIGCGTRGISLIKDLLRLNVTGHRVEIAAVCDVWDVQRNQAREITGSEAVANWRTIVERTDIDAVVIATPDHWHAPMSIAAMEAGKDVYCESPMTRTLDEAKAFRDSARKTGRIVQIGAQTVSEGQWHSARELVSGGKIGRVTRSEAGHGVLSRLDTTTKRGIWPTPETLDWREFLGDAPARSFDATRFFGWHNYWDYAGDVADLNFDRIAPLLLATGSETPIQVSAAGGVKHSGREVPDAFMMTARYKGGHTIVLSTPTPATLGMPAVVRGEMASIEFRRDRIVVSPERPSSVEYARQFGSPNPVDVPVRETRRLMENWLGAIRGGQACVCDVELGYRTMVAVALSTAAYRNRKSVYFDPASETLAEQRTSGARSTV